MEAKSRRKKAHEATGETVPSSFPLAEEVRTYEAHLPEWLDREGQFVLIKGSRVLGFYVRDREALEAGYEQIGAGPFLVKQILAQEPIYHLGDVEL